MTHRNALWWAHLNPASPRYRDWVEIFGADFVEVPISSPRDYECRLGEGTAAFMDRVYILDTRQLTPAQKDRLVARVAQKFNAAPDQVRDEIAKNGFPIRASDVIVAFSVRAFM